MPELKTMPRVPRVGLKRGTCFCPGGPRSSHGEGKVIAGIAAKPWELEQGKAGRGAKVPSVERCTGPRHREGGACALAGIGPALPGRLLLLLPLLLLLFGPPGWVRGCRAQSNSIGQAELLVAFGPASNRAPGVGAPSPQGQGAEKAMKWSLPTDDSRALLTACKQAHEGAEVGARRGEREGEGEALLGGSRERWPIVLPGAGASSSAGAGPCYSLAGGCQGQAPGGADFHSDLGWAETWGKAVHEAEAGKRACFVLAVRTKDGTPFDRHCWQRAFFVGTARSVDDTSNRTLIRLATDITYRPREGVHSVCYTLPSPGIFDLKVSLSFTNTFLVQTTLNPLNSAGLVGYVPVVSSEVRATAPYPFSLEKQRRSLPVCTLALLTRSHNRGFWVGTTWLPEVCRLRRPPPQALMKCLNGHSLLFVGDSEVRYTYSALLDYLHFPSRDKYLEFLQENPRRVSSMESTRLPKNPYAVPSTNSTVAGQNPGLEAGVQFLQETTFNLPGAVNQGRYYGSMGNGFAHQRFHHLPRNTSEDTKDMPPTLDLNLTYVWYNDVRKEMLPRTLVALSQGRVVTPNDSKPFDIVVDSNMLHGATFFENVRKYKEYFKSTLHSRMQEVCPHESCTLVAFGPWLGMDSEKKSIQVYKNNNARHVAFEAASYKLKTRMNTSFMAMDSMTGAVRGSELQRDSVHYLPRVPLAMLDMIFGSLCTDVEGALL